MARKMLIDSTHPEETRVVVVNGNKVEEFDFDSSARALITGNIYLAKVSRIEPSLQAAFVEYGGNRQGFLAFSEIHPDYYQIPQADREALMQEELERQAEEAQEEEEEDQKLEDAASNKRGKSRNQRRNSRKKVIAEEQPNDAVIQGEAEAQPENTDNDVESETGEADAESKEADGAESKPKSRKRTRKSSRAKAADEENLTAEDSESANDDLPNADDVDEVVATPEDLDDLEALDGQNTTNRSPLDDPHDEIEQAEELETEAADVEEEIRPKPSRKRRTPLHQRYRIQEVIKPRQILLVQVVKEERGNKGAALTTYISLPGRYCVLMPNTARGGGISRKISNINDRKRLRTLAKGFNVPKGAGLIIRTAGAKKNAEDIERDYAFLTRQWNQIRELTLSSTAPAAVYEESGPIKRAIRDLLTSDTDEILVEGESGYQEAREYMEVLMPERVKLVKPYQDKMPLFSRYQVQNYLSSMFNPVVQLKSGGYLVIGVTEALVAIDVNSGRSTKEASIEDTALKTNLEAAEEVARQLKLRDLAGLIVIDFIDMEQYRHQQEVENKLKDCLRKDRARIQVGRISSFGLLEMSRQRLRTGLVEAITTPCPHCQGTGILRSDDSVALSVIRAIEEEIARGRAGEINVNVSPAIANYLFNEKRDYIVGFSDQYGVLVRIVANPELHNSEFTLEKQRGKARASSKKEPVSAASVMEQGQNGAEADEVRNEGKNGSSRRRRRGGRGRKKDQNNQAADAQNDANTSGEAEVEAQNANSEGEGNQSKRKSKSRSSRGGAKNEAANADAPAEAAEANAKGEKPKRKRRTKAEIEAEKSTLEAANADAPTGATEANAKDEKPKRKRRTKAEIEADKAAKEAEKAAKQAAKAETADAADAKDEKPKRKRRTKAEIEAEKAQKETTKDDTNTKAAKAKPAKNENSESSVEAAPATPKKEEKKRTGWWSL